MVYKSMIKRRKLILVGGGGHCKSCIDVIESTEQYEITGILDIPERIGHKVLNYDIIDCDDNMDLYIQSDILFLTTVGQIKSPEKRISLHNKVKGRGGKFVSIISKTAHTSEYATIGTDTVIMHQAFVNANAEIGRGCIINTFANIEHDVIVNDFCHISTGAIINGGCIIGEKTFIGSGSVIINDITIFPETIIAAGSVVVKDIKEKGIYGGNPARLLKRI
jgi:sugar O-acyltransferase (sialic acid O-acetyltransferase NeuD family)